MFGSERGSKQFKILSPFACTLVIVCQQVRSLDNDSTATHVVLIVSISRAIEQTDGEKLPNYPMQKWSIIVAARCIGHVLLQE